MAKAKVYNVALLLQQARAGSLSISEMQKEVSRLHDRGTPVARDAAMELRAIIQREQGKKAVAAIGDPTPGSAKWAFAELGAAQVTPYRWSATTADGRVVITLWDEPGRFMDDYLPLSYRADSADRLRRIENSSAMKQNRDAYFRDLEVAVAAHKGLVNAILQTAVDINAVVRQRASGSCRPWLNEDRTPVLLRILDLDIHKHSYEFEFAEPNTKPRCPFDDAQVPCTSSKTEDKMLDAFMQKHPGSYYIEVPLADGRRVDAVRVPAARTVRIDGADFDPSLAAAEVDVIEVKQGRLAREVVDQAIGSAEAFSAIYGIKARPVAVVEHGSPSVEKVAHVRAKTFMVFATRSPLAPDPL
jgi:hypothetical protein